MANIDENLAYPQVAMIARVNESNGIFLGLVSSNLKSQETF